MFDKQYLIADHSVWTIARRLDELDALANVLRETAEYEPLGLFLSKRIVSIRREIGPILTTGGEANDMGRYKAEAIGSERKDIAQL